MQDKIGEKKKYSQNDEDLHIVNYFKGFTGTLLSIGENDGKTLSNSLRLIKKGWTAFLVEPSPKAFNQLSELHENNDRVYLCNAAIGVINGKGILHESGAHFSDKSDISLLSSLDVNETERWKQNGVEFKECEVNVITYDNFASSLDYPTFDFITIDAEGLDISILKQIDLTYTKLLCIEWNSIEENKKEILEYCSTFGMDNIIYQSGENLLICRKP